MTAATTMRMGGAGVTTRDHCPTCGHRHQRGPTGRLVCGGDDGTCKCDPADPCRCGVCEMARASRAVRKPSAGWASRHDGLLLGVAGHLAQVSPHDPIGGWAVWRMNRDSVGGWMLIASGAENGEAAQLAAEDALLAIAAEIVGAVGR